MSQLSQTAIEAFKADFSGSVVLPNDVQYEEARHIWNAMIDRRPSIIARCTSPDDVVKSLNFVRRHDLPFSVRGSGHNIAGNSACDDDVMIVVA
ncbi:FAD-binding protein [Halomonas sp. SH5A2]|uniref:FAD-binding protein n=1 Tax=Halomonas sp. SH5A2 TaxID=2749040 RepID=UPI00164192C9|nr:FAD-binding protein [Halomonas sp. SH5A2]QNI02546.1 FAD-binding protein [Halomonas sp. SH5A2]